MLKRVAVCCSVLQSPFYDLFEGDAVVDLKKACRVLQYVAVCCNVLQRVAACCSVLQPSFYDLLEGDAVVDLKKVCLVNIQCTATHCNTLQYTATHCITLQYRC